MNTEGTQHGFEVAHVMSPTSTNPALHAHTDCNDKQRVVMCDRAALIASLAAALKVIEDVTALALDLEADAEQVAGMLTRQIKLGRVPNVAMQEAYNADAIAKRHAAQRIRAITNKAN